MQKVDFQARATKEGRNAQAMAKGVIETCGFEQVRVNERLGSAGITANLVGTSKHGRKWYFIVSGAIATKRPGLVRTDTVFKVLGKSSVLAQESIEPVVLLTTNLPVSGSEGDRALRATQGRVFFDAMEMLSVGSRRRLGIYAHADAVTRPLPGFWSLEDLYGPTLGAANPLGAPRSAPLTRTGDPFGALVPRAARSMGHRLKLFIPSQTQDGHLISDERRQSVLAWAKSELITLGGGVTSHEARGHWVNPLGGMADENVIVLETYFAKAPSNNGVASLVRSILQDLDQAAVAVVLDDRMYEFTE
ncbi:MAG: hypothetical protein R6X34_17595 [Chloroflexota bacterium]